MNRVSFVLLITIILALFYPAPAELRNQAGFIEIEPINFYFHFNSYFNRLDLTSSTARLWYSFHPAYDKGEQKPLFVFFNGGPGAGTSQGLMSLNTAPLTMDTLNPELEWGGDHFVENPNSWTRLGNILYIDARAAGFSYNLMENSQNAGLRYREFDTQNFNCFLDGADFIRLLLRFLSTHPEIQDNPVVIMAESYGGVRASVMLHMLLNYQDYGNGTTMYQDHRLVEEIQYHYNKVFPAYSGSTVPREVIARQFGHQVLIQPILAGKHQTTVTGEMFEEDDSDIFQIAAQVGAQYKPCATPQCEPQNNALLFIANVAERDCYHFAKPLDWMDGIFQNAARVLRYTSELSKITGVNVKDIPLFYASVRADAYRIGEIWYKQNDLEKQAPGIRLMQQSHKRILDKPNEVKAGDLESVFGELNFWDRYFLTTNYNVNSCFYYNVAELFGYPIDPYSEIYGLLFLENLAYVRTFITNARFDLVVYSRAIPQSLAKYDRILEKVVHYREPMVGQERAGQILLTYKEGAFSDLPHLETRTIRFPIYNTSGHAVTITQPGEFLEDVTVWLGKTGEPVIETKNQTGKLK